MSSHPIRILYLEDNEDDVLLLKRVLSKSELNVVLIHKTSKEDLEVFLKNEVRPDLIISDFNLNGFNGADALQIVRAIDPVVPFLFLSGTLGEERAVGLMRKGADDYILKGHDARIPRTIMRLLQEAKNKRNQIQNEQEIIQKNAILQTIMESVGDLLFLKDADRNYITFNKAFEEHFDLSIDEARGKKDEELFRHEFVYTSRESDLYVLRYNTRILFETEYINSQGERIILETLKTPLHAEDGLQRGIVGVSRDITKKKMQEEQLRRKEMLLNQSERQTKSGSFELQTKQKVIHCSDQFLEILGFESKANKLPFASFISRIYEAERVIVREAIEMAVRNQELFEMEHRCIPKWSKNIIHCRTSMKPDVNSYENTIYYGTIVDITEERTNKNAILDAQENERRLLAAELHDSLTQKLVAASMYLSSMNSENLRLDRITTADELIRSALEETRRLSRNLSLHSMENMGLKNSLLDIIESFPSEIAINYHFEFEEEDVSPEVTMNLYRIIQEALANVMKYAKATKVFIGIERSGSAILCSIKDDGIGFDLSLEDTVGNGLKNIRQRVAKCNGILNLQSTPGKGTHFDILVPSK